jgi:phosphoglycerate-specific signal transduction histidine kinase
MILNQNFEIQRLNEYMERIDAIVYEMKCFMQDCSSDTRVTVVLTAHCLNNAMDDLAVGIAKLEEVGR